MLSLSRTQTHAHAHATTTTQHDNTHMSRAPRVQLTQKESAVLPRHGHGGRTVSRHSGAPYMYRSSETSLAEHRAQLTACESAMIARETDRDLFSGNPKSQAQGVQQQIAGADDLCDLFHAVIGVDASDLQVPLAPKSLYRALSVRTLPSQQMPTHRRSASVPMDFSSSC